MESPVGRLPGLTFSHWHSEDGPESLRRGFTERGGGVRGLSAASPKRGMEISEKQRNRVGNPVHAERAPREFSGLSPISATAKV
jgi:hypothetical protein